MSSFLASSVPQFRIPATSEHFLAQYVTVTYRNLVGLLNLFIDCLFPLIFHLNHQEAGAMAEKHVTSMWFLMAHGTCHPGNERIIHCRVKKKKKPSCFKCNG